MGVLESNKRLSLADLILALRSGNPDQIAAVLVDLSVQFKPFDETAFRREFERMYYTQTMFSAEGAGEGFSQLISGALGLMYKHGLRLDPDLTLAIKALTQFEEISRTLDPEMSMVDTSFEASRKLLVQQLNTDTVSQLVQKELMRTGREIVRRLPSLSDATLSWLDQYQSGKLTLYIDSRDLSKNLEDFGWGVRQLAIAVLLVAILFGSASAMESGLLNHVRYAPTVLAALFLIALFVAFLWVFKMVREVWKSGG
jgi:predicted unusual protein kinase regulating ubiquinone biosynthesis (AarF/ABC1/UbiB family)